MVETPNFSDSSSRAGSLGLFSYVPDARNAVKNLVFFGGSVTLHKCPDKEAILPSSIPKASNC